ncbi:MAG: DUF2064 domain-containing protein [Phycisphaerae bacterium]|nr:DUF2064 domain-containing protein [Phycisphaerae bacterium]MDW8261153.1 DUF2064 domain-containing protein [Phycisphaerales bacterium]
MSNPIVAVVMTKLPEAGRVKTRLMPALSAAEAARVHEVFLVHWVGRLMGLKFDRVVICYDPPGSEPAFRAILPLGRRLDFVAQAAGDLGARLASAAESQLCSGRGIVFFGVDSPDVPEGKIDLIWQRVRAGASALSPQVVLAPCSDGGFWALGLTGRIDCRRLLERIHWSSGTEYRQLLDRASALGCDAPELPEAAWDDVDHPADLAKLLRRLSRSGLESDAALYNALAFVPRERLT